MKRVSFLQREANEILAAHRPFWRQLRGGDMTTPVDQAVPEFLESIQSLFDQGYNLTDVGLMFGLTRERMRQLTTKHGIVRFPYRTPFRIWSWERQRFVALPMNRYTGNVQLAKQQVRDRRQKQLDNYAERFWQQVKIGADNECWLWQGKTVQTRPNYPYGLWRALSYRGVNARGWRTADRYAHRIAYELSYGEAPGDALVCHTCDVGICVNPSHLFSGTQADNVHDAIAKGRHIASPQRREERRLMYQLRAMRRKRQGRAS